MNTILETDLTEFHDVSSFVTELPKNMLVQTPETCREGIYFIKRGKFRFYKVNPEGKQFTLEILGKGELFGEIESFSFGTKDTFIECIEDALLYSFDKEQLEQFLDAHPTITKKFLRLLSARMREREKLLEKMALGDVRERVLYQLAKLCKQFGIEEHTYHRIDLRLSHQELANMIGTTRESVTIVLNNLVKEGMIKAGRLSIRVKKTEISGYFD